MAISPANVNISWTLLGVITDEGMSRYTIKMN
jgi:hypothetical protein